MAEGCSKCRYGKLIKGFLNIQLYYVLLNSMLLSFDYIIYIMYVNYFIPFSSNVFS